MTAWNRGVDDFRNNSSYRIAPLLLLWLVNGLQFSWGFANAVAQDYRSNFTKIFPTSISAAYATALTETLTTKLLTLYFWTLFSGHSIFAFGETQFKGHPKIKEKTTFVYLMFHILEQLVRYASLNASFSLWRPLHASRKASFSPWRLRISASNNSWPIGDPIWLWNLIWRRLARQVPEGFAFSPRKNSIPNAMRDDSEQEIKYNQNLSAIDDKLSGFQEIDFFHSVQSRKKNTLNLIDEWYRQRGNF